MTNVSSSPANLQNNVLGGKPSKPQKSPHFSGDMQYRVTRSVGVEGIQNTTTLFRYHDQFLALPEILKTHFPEGCTIYDYACSDGSEPYSIAMVLDDAKLSEKYPIMARDLSPEMIAMAKTGYVTGSHNELELIKKLAPKLKPEDYLKKIPEEKRKKIAAQVAENLKKDKTADLEPDEIERIAREIGPPVSTRALYQVPPELRRHIQFQVGDLSVDKLRSRKDPKPSLILFNTAMQHLNTQQQQHILRHVYKSAAPGSIMMIGDGGFVDAQMAQEIGFKDISSTYSEKFAEGILVLQKPVTKNHHWFAQFALRFRPKGTTATPDNQ